MLSNKLIFCDGIKKIKELKTESVHLILSDIPYGISYDEWDVLHDNNNSALLGCSPAQEKTSLFKHRGKPLNGWSSEDKKISKEYEQWCSSWANEWLRVLKPGASCFIFAGRRYAHRCIAALEDAGFIFKDMIAWEKDSAAHRAQNVSKVFERRNDYLNKEKWNGWKLGNLRPLFEPILWFIKPYPQGGTLTDNIVKYEVGGFNEKKLKELLEYNVGIEICSNVIRTKSEDSDRGLHPTQKPLLLMKILIELTTLPGQIVLDPFMGSGTTCVAAKECDRKYIGFEKNPEYYKIAKKRLSSKKN